MKVAAIEVVQSKAPVDLPEPWRPAWKEPDTAPVTSQGFGFFRVHTDDGITGIGPAGPDHNSLLAAARASADLIGREPSEIGRFFDVHMRGRDSTHGVPSLSTNALPLKMPLSGSPGCGTSAAGW